MRIKKKLIKSRKHLEWIAANHCCIICGNSEIQVAHIRHLPSGNIGMSQKDDRYTIGLCYMCHQEQHKMNEKKFWKNYNINPIKIAQDLCKMSPCKKVKNFGESINYFNERR